MIDIYYLLLLVLVSIGSSFITTQMPRIKSVFKRVLTWFKPKSRKVVTQEEPVFVTHKELEILVQQINNALATIDNNSKQSIAKAEEALKVSKKRDSDRTSKVKSIVIDYLKELQK